MLARRHVNSAKPCRRKRLDRASPFPKEPHGTSWHYRAPDACAKWAARVNIWRVGLENSLRLSIGINGYRISPRADRGSRRSVRIRAKTATACSPPQFLVAEILRHFCPVVANGACITGGHGWSSECCPHVLASLSGPPGDNPVDP
jgi:hypothetical protein